MTVARGPLLVALILRLRLPAAAILSGVSVSRFITPDTNSYLTPARLLLERGAFSNLSGPEIFRTPGYPLALTPGLIVGHPILVTLLLQALAGTLTVWADCLLFPRPLGRNLWHGALPSPDRARNDSARWLRPLRAPRWV